jgi:hypothetical protein
MRWPVTIARNSPFCRHVFGDREKLAWYGVSARIQPLRGLLDLRPPFQPALELQTLTKRLPRQGRLFQAEIQGSQVHEGVCIRLIEGEDSFDSLSRVVPSALKVRFHRVSKKPFDLLPMTLGMAQPDPP